MSGVQVSKYYTEYDEHFLKLYVIRGEIQNFCAFLQSFEHTLRKRSVISLSCAEKCTELNVIRSETALISFNYLSSTAVVIHGCV